MEWRYERYDDAVMFLYDIDGHTKRFILCRALPVEKLLHGFYGVTPRKIQCKSTFMCEKSGDAIIFYITLTKLH